jgi:hypothetical protein
MKTPTLFLAAVTTLLSLATGIRLPPATGQGSDLAHYMSVRAARDDRCHIDDSF